MSQKNTGVLAHYQSVEVRATTHVPREVADELVRRMICERVSNKLIRMFPPQSLYLAARSNRPPTYSTPERMPPREVGGCVFRGPKNPLKRSVYFRHVVEAPTEVSA